MVDKVKKVVQVRDSRRFVNGRWIRVKPHPRQIWVKQKGGKK